MIEFLNIRLYLQLLLLLLLLLLLKCTHLSDTVTRNVARALYTVNAQIILAISPICLVILSLLGKL